MHFYCQNTIRPKKDTKVCLRAEKWSRSVQHLFLIFTQSLLNPPFCFVFVQNPSMCLFFHVRFVPCAFFINKQFRTCANAFPNEFTVRSYGYCAGKHCILYWIQENKTVTNFLRSRLFTYDIMKNFNCNQYKTSNIGNF